MHGFYQEAVRPQQRPESHMPADIATRLPSKDNEHNFELESGASLRLRASRVSLHTLTQWSDQSRQKSVLLGALLILLTFAVYSPVRHHEFLQFDDGPYVTNNPHVRTGFTADNVLWAFTSTIEVHWHPLTWLSHMLDCQVFGLNSGAHHLVNLALHAANVLLLFFLLSRATRSVAHSFFVTALFAVHPLNVENVAWVAERKTLLCTFFSLLTILAYEYYLQRRGWKRYLTIVCLFVLALLAKSIAVVLPVVLLLIDYWPLHRESQQPFFPRWRSLIYEKLPLFALSLACAAVTVIAARSAGTLADTSVLPWTDRLENAVVSYAVYLAKAIWPANLSVYYPPPVFPLPRLAVAASLLVILLLTLAALHFHRARYLTMGWLLFLVTLLPVIGIIQVGRQALADRYMYAPCLGLFVIIVWGSHELLHGYPTLLRVRAVGLSLAILLLAISAARYLSSWQDGVTLFSRASAVAKQPDQVIEEALADSLSAAARDRDAYQHYAKACTLSPRYDYCHFHMAQILHQHGQLQDAFAQYQLAGSLTNSKEMQLACLVNSGAILLEIGDRHSAQTEIDAALKLDPHNEVALQLRNRLLTQSDSPR